MADTSSGPAPAAPAAPVPAARRGLRLGLRVKFTATLTAFILAIVLLASGAIIRQQTAALDKEVRERGLALANALASNSVEPISLGADALQLMLLARTVVQTADDPEAARRLVGASETLPAMVWRYVRAPESAAPAAGVRNEGVLFAAIVDASGSILAAADALRPLEATLAEIGSPYRPPPRTALLSPSDGARIWDSPLHHGTYVIGVPIRHRRAAPPAAEGSGTGAAGAAPPGAAGRAEPGVPAAASDPAGAQFMGAVYLGMSQAIVRRSVALALSKITRVALAALLVGALAALVISTRLVRPIQALRAGALRVGAGDLDTAVHIRRRDELGQLARAFNEMTRGLAERELIRGAFGAYVSSDVLDDILANPEAMKTIGGVKRTVTMIFTDVRGFTAMSGRLQAEAVVGTINEYLDVQAKAVRRHKGHLDKYIGDAVRAVFGVPSERPDDAARAVRCAWEIKREIAKLIADRKARGLVAPLIGIGVDTGEVVAGNIGAASAKLEYTVIGHPVGLSEMCMDAARDPNAEGGQIVLTEHTYEQVKDLVEVRELPALSLHGGTLRVYELTGLREAAPAAASSPSP
jgi:class 3 adenylate cyclase